MKKLLSLLVVFVMVFAMAACGTGSTSAPSPSASSTPPSASLSPSEAPTPSAAPETIKFTDSAGREVEVPAKITRIAASGAMAQIVLFALAPEMLVGIASKWSDAATPYIAKEYLNLPVLGQFYGSGDLNLEEIAAQAPQVIIDVGEAKKTIVEDMDGITAQVGIPTIHIDATTDSMADAYRTLGKLLGLEDKAETLAQYCETVNARTNDLLAQLGEDKKTSLVYCLGDNGLNVLAKDSFHAEIIDMLSSNAAVVDDPSSKGSGNPIDMEQLLKWNPDVILFAPGSVYSTVGTDAAWQKLHAIADGRYYEVPNGPYNWMGFPPSVNRYMGMIWMAQLLYPELAGYDMYKETAKYYELFYHCTLTEDQYKTLVANSLGK